MSTLFIEQTPDGTCIRDYIHVAYLAAAHLMVLQALESHDQLIYNLGNGQGFSVREVIETVRKITGHLIPSRETERRPGDPAALVASSEKIQNELGWKPRHPDLESIIRSAWEWQQKHPQLRGPWLKISSGAAWMLHEMQDVVPCRLL